MQYKNTQYGFFITILFSIISLGIFLAYWFQTGSKPLPFGAFVVIFLLFLVIILLFYKLTITIDDSKIIAKLGVGMLKTEMSLSEIDIESIEKIKLPWYYGIGIRITPKGTLYNVKVGENILIKNKSKTKTFLVGTNDFETIKETILKLKNNK